MKRNQGITLIALVVTIIVLLILAGVTLSFVAGENGILKRATKAVHVTEIASAKEQAELLMGAYVTDYYEKKYVQAQSDKENAREYIFANFPSEGEQTEAYWVKVEKDTNKVKVYKNKEDEKEIVVGTLKESGVIVWENSTTGGDGENGGSTGGSGETGGDGENGGSTGDSGETGGENESSKSIFTYTIADNSVTITGLTEENKNLTQIEIPEQIEGKNVIAIGATAFKDYQTLQSVTMPDTVTSLGNDVFAGTTSLSEIKLSNNLQTVGDYAFRLSGIRNITFPPSLKNMGEMVISFSKIEEVIFEGKDCTFARGALRNATNLKRVTLPSELTVLANTLFYQCTALTTVTIPNTVTEIKEFAFSGCTALTTLTIPSSLTTIRGMAFSECNNLILTIPTTVTSIDFGTGMISDTKFTFYNVKLLQIPSRWQSTINGLYGTKRLTAGAQDLKYI